MVKCIFEVYCYDLDKDVVLCMQMYEFEIQYECMLFDVLVKLKVLDEMLLFCCLCCEGVCGLDVMNINGKNGFVCLMNLNDLLQKIVLCLLLGLFVVCDLIVDMMYFFNQYYLIKLYLINDVLLLEKECFQLLEECDEFDGVYECILCVSCLMLCLSFWWNLDKFVGLVGLLQVYCFIVDSCDMVIGECFDNLEDLYCLFCCYMIMNCVDVCLKGLNLMKVIGKIKELMVCCVV